MASEEILDELLLKWEAEFDGGRDIPAAVLCCDHPHLADRLTREIDKLRRLRPDRAATSAGEEAVPQLPPGMLPCLTGYEVLEEIGRGGMGVVYKARQVSLNRPVAVKMLLHGPLADAGNRKRFLAEAQAVGRLQHPNIVQVYEVAEQDGRPYFTMELVEGGSLDRRLGGKPQPVREASELLLTLAQAVHASHCAGIVHRDLKPGNVLLTPHGFPKVSDFGLAKFVMVESFPSSKDGQAHSAARAQTRTGAILGTPSYMAPEQAFGRRNEIGPAADVYALGAILYEMLTGRPPFEGPTLLETLELVRDRDPVAPRQLQPGVPRDLETICLKCLRKEPQHRYGSALALAEDLRRFLAGQPIQARAVGPFLRSWKWIRRNPLKAVTAATFLLLFLAFFLWFQEMGRRNQIEEGNLKKRLADSRGEENLAVVHLQANRFAEAATCFDKASKHLQDDVSLRQRSEKLDHKSRKVQAIAEVYRLDNEGWFLAGEEEFDGQARETLEKALQLAQVKDAAGGFRGPRWWQCSLTEELSDEQARQFYENIYYQLVLLSLLHAREGLMLKTATAWNLVVEKENPKAARAFELALEHARQARALEQALAISPTTTIRILEREFPLLTKWARGETTFVTLLATPANAHRTPLHEMNNPADSFIVGSALFFAGKFQDDRMSQVLSGRLKNDLDFDTPLESAEELLRAGAKLESRQIWPHFLLGWLLYDRENYSAAELAFDLCVALRPNYPRGYQHRGLAIVRHALQLLESHNDLSGAGKDRKDDRGKNKRDRHGRRKALMGVAKELFVRARRDFRQGRLLAEHDPVTYWLEGDVLYILEDFAEKQEKGSAELKFEGFAEEQERFRADLKHATVVQAYARALDLEYNIRRHTIRRNFLNVACKQIQARIKGQPKNALAYTVLAQAYYNVDRNLEARSLIQKAMKIDPNLPRAQALRGIISLDGRRYDDALRDFEAALRTDPELYLAALGRARALEKKGNRTAALAGYDYLLKPGKTGYPLAATSRQQRDTQEKRAQLLRLLGRPADAQAAQDAANRIDPAALQRRAADPRKISERLH
jgi:serine/threonine protein kinase